MFETQLCILKIILIKENNTQRRFFLTESEKSHQRNPHLLSLCPHLMELGWNKGHPGMTQGMTGCLDPDLDKFCGFEA